MNNTATFTFQGASVTLAASSPSELLIALGVFGLGTPATNKATKSPSPTPAPAADAGNASASTATPASVPPASAGSEANAGSPHPYNYNDIQARVVSMVKSPKIGRDKALGLLGEFGVDHANKLKLEQYADFVAKADKLLEAA